MFVVINTREGSYSDIDYDFFGLFDIPEGVDYEKMMEEFNKPFPGDIEYPAYHGGNQYSKEYSEYCTVCHNLRVERKDKIDEVLKHYESKYETDDYYQMVIRFLEEHGIKKIECLEDCVSKPEED